MSKTDSVRSGRSTITPQKSFEEPQNARTGGGKTILEKEDTYSLDGERPEYFGKKKEAEIKSTGFEKIVRKLHFFYKYRILPSVEDFRGATRPLIESREYLLGKVDSVDEAEPVSEFEWDNLIILDGCRLDTYQEAVNLQADSRISAGSTSWEFLEENFSEGDRSDTVYISANPYTHPDLFKEHTGREIGEVFHEVFNLLYDDRYYSEEAGVVRPESVREVAELAAKLYPKKRLIIHFMQPHHPFLTSDSEPVKISKIGRGKHELDTPWEKAERGDLSHAKVSSLYKENLYLVWNEVEKLQESLTGTTVVTADHGNFLGEKGFYGHPGGRSEKPVREIPWDVISE